MSEYLARPNQQVSQRTSLQPAQGSQSWASSPGYAAAPARPQHAPDGRLSDLLPTGRTPLQVGGQPASLPQELVRPQQSQQAVVHCHTGMQPPHPHSQQQHWQRQQQPVSSQPQLFQQSTGHSHGQATGNRQATHSLHPQTQTSQLPIQWAQPHMHLRPAGQAQLPFMYHQAPRPVLGYTPPASAAVAQHLNAIVSTMRPTYGPHQQAQFLPSPQLSNEDRKVLPRKSLKRKAVAATGDHDADLDMALEAALIQVADEFITSSVALACGLARRRKAKRLEAADIAVHLERMWQLRVPGFAASQVQPYKRIAASDLHRNRILSIRKGGEILQSFRSQG